MPFKVEMVKSENEKNREELWKFYEKAIEGRNAFYNHYVKYVNLYAIFTGALFVAFYTLLGKGDCKLYAVFVACLGMITSILWLCSVKGYYSWIISWINVVKYYEERLNSGLSVHEACFVYGLYYDCNKDSCILTKPSSFSTQKLTMLFVELMIIGWFFSIILLFASKQITEIFQFLFVFYPVVVYLIIFCVVFASIIVCGRIREKLKDNVEDHYKLKRTTREHFSVESPLPPNCRNKA